MQMLLTDGPCTPLGPARPLRPGSPAGPRCPLTPGMPGGPTGPGAPIGPTAPLGPRCQKKMFQMKKKEACEYFYTTTDYCLYPQKSVISMTNF